MKRIFSFLLLLSILGVYPVLGKNVPVIRNEKVAETNLLWDLKALSKAPRVQWIEKEGSARSLFFDGVAYQGKPTRVFAYYSDPDLLMGRPAGHQKYPGVVLLHGGAGRAFRMWAEKWAAYGYAAIAVDLSGNGKDGVRLPDGGPDLSDNQQVFFDIEKGDPRNMWTYHAVATGILAHSLLLSLPAVDPDRTCLTGISWGGYLTCIVGSLDNRFRAAAPVYGCGYYDELPFFGKGMMDELSPAGRERWMDNLDASLYLPYANIPFLFVSGNGDTAYQLFAWDKSYRLIPDSLRTVCIRPGMKHGYFEGWEPEEIYCFFESVVNGGCPLPRIGKTEIGDSIRVGFDSRLFRYSGEFYYSNDTGADNVNREWKVLSGTLDQQQGVFSCPLPAEGFKIGFVKLKDIRLNSVSTEFIIRTEEN